jgi:hypothetical protein
MEKLRHNQTENLKTAVTLSITGNNKTTYNRKVGNRRNWRPHETTALAKPSSI